MAAASRLPGAAASGRSRTLRPKSRRRAAAALAAVLATLASARGVPPASAGILTRHVVIVAIDGARYTETLGDPTLAWHPRIGLGLVPIGAVPAACRNLGVTVTNPGMAALATATWQPIANDGAERPHAPTVGECLRQTTGAPASASWIVAGKAKLSVLAHSDHPAYGAAYASATDVGHGSDEATFLAARTRLLENRPRLMIVNLGLTDVRGHLNDWTGYLGAIRTADSLVWELWTAIQADTGLAGRTTLFVTNDHGRHDDAHGGFQNHGDGCEGCRRVELVMVGPDTRAGHASSAQYDLRDIPRTAAHLLGVPMPFAEGRALDDLLLEPTTPLDAPEPRAGLRAPILAAAPNPAIGAVRLTLASAAGGERALEVFDVGGRRIAGLPMSPSGSDRWQCAWDGRDAEGRAVAPGLYLARVATPAGVAMARVSLMR